MLWHDPGVDRAYEEIAGLLYGLLIRLDDRLSGKDVALIAEFIEANELGLALEQLADVLSEDVQPLSPDERADMLSAGRSPAEVIESLAPWSSARSGSAPRQIRASGRRRSDAPLSRTQSRHFAVRCASP